MSNLLFYEKKGSIGNLYNYLISIENTLKNDIKNYQKPISLNQQQQFIYNQEQPQNTQQNRNFSHHQEFINHQTNLQSISPQYPKNKKYRGHTPSNKDLKQLHPQTKASRYPNNQNSNNKQNTFTSGSSPSKKNNPLQENRSFTPTNLHKEDKEGRKKKEYTSQNIQQQVNLGKSNISLFNNDSKNMQQQNINTKEYSFYIEKSQLNEEPEIRSEIYRRKYDHINRYKKFSIGHIKDLSNETIKFNKKVNFELEVMKIHSECPEGLYVNPDPGPKSKRSRLKRHKNFNYTEEDEYKKRSNKLKKLMYNKLFQYDKRDIDKEFDNLNHEIENRIECPEIDKIKDKMKELNEEKTRLYTQISTETIEYHMDLNHITYHYNNTFNSIILYLERIEALGLEVDKIDNKP